MKKALCFSNLMIVALLLSACSSAATPTTSNVIQEVYTAVAETISAPAAASVTPTATLPPTATSLPTATLYVFPTASPTSTYVWYSHSTGTNYGCYDAVYVKDMTIPDGTILTPGETFVKTWKLQNTGSCTWTDAFSIVLISGDDMDGSDTEIDQTVYANKKAEISVSLSAPDDEGTYIGYWQMSDEYDNLFGELVSVEIVVTEPTATSAPTTTLTPTITPTAILTSTPTTDSTETLTPLPTTTSTPTTVYTSVPTSDATETLTPLPTTTSTPTRLPTETMTPVPTAIPTDTPVSTPTPEDEPTSYP